MCRCSGEIVEHLLLHCNFAFKLWSCVFCTFGLSWVLPKMVTDRLFQWWNWLGKQSSHVWNLVPLCLMWTLWWECNCCTFEDLEISGTRLIELFSRMLFDWSWVCGFTSYNFILELESLLSCTAVHNIL